MVEQVKPMVDFDGRPQAVLDAGDRAEEPRPWWEAPSIARAKEAVEACRLRFQEVMKECMVEWHLLAPRTRQEFSAAVAAFDEAWQAECEAIRSAKLDRYGSVEAWRRAECG